MSHHNSNDNSDDEDADIVEHLLEPQSSMSDLWHAVVIAHCDEDDDRAFDKKGWCDICHKTNNQLDMMPCSSIPNCPKLTHIACAYSSYQGMTYSDGIFALECKSHFKPPTFCICHTKYDPTKPMICCDGCMEWFHFDCIGLRANSTKTVDYVCDDCQTSRKDKIQRVRAQNEIKEIKDSTVGEAKKHVKVLYDLSEQVCNIVDTISMRGSASQKNLKSDLIFSIEDIISARDAIQEYNKCVAVSMSITVATATSAEEDDVMNEDNDDVMQKDIVWDSGAQEITQQWEDTLTLFIRDYMKWTSGLGSVIEKINKKLIPKYSFQEYYHQQQFEFYYLLSIFEVTGDDVPSTTVPLYDQLAKYEESLSQFQCVRSFITTVFPEVFQNLTKLRLIYENVMSGTDDIDFFELSIKLLKRISESKVNYSAEQHGKKKKQELNNASSYLVTCIDRMCSYTRETWRVFKEIYTIVQEIEQIMRGQKAFTVNSLVGYVGRIESSCGNDLGLRSAADIDNLLVSSEEAEEKMTSILKSKDTSEFMTLYDEVVAMNLTLSSSAIVDQIAEACKAVSDFQQLINGNSRFSRVELEKSRNCLENILASSTPMYKSVVLYTCAIANVNKSLLMIDNFIEQFRLASRDMPDFSFDNYDLWINVDVSKHLSDFHTSRIISEEEVAIHFIQQANYIVGSINDSLNRGSPVQMEGLRKACELAQRLLEQDDKSASKETSNSALSNIQKSFRRSLTKFTKLLSSSEALWGKVAETIESAHNGTLIIALEDFSNQRKKAIESNVLNNAVLQQADDLLAQSSLYTEKVATYLKQLDKYFVFNEVDIDYLNELWTEGQTMLLPRDMLLTINDLHAAGIVLEKCRQVNQSCAEREGEGGKLLSPRGRNMSELLELKTEASQLLPKIDALSCLELAVKNVVEPFMLNFWRLQANNLLQSSAAIDLCSVLLEEGRNVSGALQSDEGARLEKEVQNGRALEAKIVAFCSTVDSVIDSFSSYGDFRLTEEHFLTTCSLSEAAIRYLEGVLDDWAAVVTSWKLDEMHSQLIAEEKALHVSLPLKGESKLIVSLLRLVPQLGQIVRSAHTTGRHSQVETDGLSHGVISQADVDKVLANLKAIQLLKPKFLLLQNFSVYFSKLASEASKWEQAAGCLLPSKFTRNANKSAAKTSITALKNELKKEISKVIRIQVQDTLTNVISEAEEHTINCLHLLTPASDSSIRSRDEMIRDLTTVDSERQALLWEEITEVYNIQNKMTLVQVSLPEQKVVDWFYNLLYWMQGVPMEDLTMIAYITYEDAEEKLRKLDILQIPENVLEVLASFELVNADGTLRADINPSISRAQMMYRHLEKELKRTERAHKLARKKLADGGKPSSDPEVKSELKKLINEMNTLIVKPIPSIKKAIESMFGMRGIEEKEKPAVDPRLVSRPPPLPAGAAGDGKVKSQKALSKGITLAGAIKRQRSDDVPVSGALPFKKEAKLPVLAKEIKSVMNPCLHSGCTKSVIAGSAYCSDTCAYKYSAEMMKSLLEYRRELIKTNALKRSIGGYKSESIKPSDLKAFDYQKLNVDESVNAMLSGLSRLGYVVASNDSEHVSLATAVPQCRDLIYTLSGGAISRVGHDVDKKLMLYNQIIQNVAQKKKSGHVALSYSLPFAAGCTLSLSSTSTGGGGGSVVPMRQAVTGSSNNNKHLSSGAGVAINEAESRNIVRSTLEEVLCAAMSRLAIYHPLAQAVVLAFEVEEDLYQMYFADRELNKKGYNKHHLMLMRNMKFTHNDRLVASLLAGEKSVADFLKLSSEELADSSTKELRAAQRETMKHSLIIESRDEAIEKKRRETTSNREELWRGRDSPASKLIAESTNNQQSMLVEPTQLIDIDAMEIEDQQVSYTAESPQIQLKRAFDGYSNDTSDGELPKIARFSEDVRIFETRAVAEEPSYIESFTKPAVESVVTIVPPVPNKQKPSIIKEPKISKGLSVLELLKSSSGSNADKLITKSESASGLALQPLLRNSSADGSDISEEEVIIPAEGVIKRHFMKLVASDGSTDFKLSYPDFPELCCTGITTERRIQGLIPPQVHVEGRVQLDKTSSYFDSILERQTRILAEVRFTVTGETGPGSGYMLFCDEFIKKRRVGVYKISDKVELYIIPPPLKGYIQCIQDHGGVDASRVLLGIIIAKEEGPPMFVTAKPQFVDIQDTKDTNIGGAVESSSAFPPPISSFVTAAATSTLISDRAPSGEAPPQTTSVVINSNIANHYSVIVNSTISEISPELSKNIDKVIGFLSKSLKGSTLIAMFQALQKKPQARTSVPFIFPEDPNYSIFISRVRAAFPSEVLELLTSEVLPEVVSHAPQTAAVISSSSPHLLLPTNSSLSTVAPVQVGRGRAATLPSWMTAQEPLGQGQRTSDNSDSQEPRSTIAEEDRPSTSRNTTSRGVLPRLNRFK